jgi:hypothetical protein
MYREISRMNTKLNIFRLTIAQQRLKHRELFALPKVNSRAAAGDESEALVAAISFGALVIVSLACLVQAWL